MHVILCVTICLYRSCFGYPFIMQHLFHFVCKLFGLLISTRAVTADAVTAAVSARIAPKLWNNVFEQFPSARLNLYFVLGLLNLLIKKILVTCLQLKINSIIHYDWTFINAHSYDMIISHNSMYNSTIYICICSESLIQIIKR